jgi:cation diffusion facilitator family transporter
VDLSRFAWLSIGAALATMTIKGTAAWLTGSVSLLSDAAESLINLVAAIIALIALKISIKPPDRRHQFGHSKAEYFSAAVEGIMIFVAAAYIIYIAVERLIAPVMPERLEIGLLISIGASIINGVVAFVLLRKGRASGSITLVADGRHLLTDVITSAAVLIGVLLVVITDQPRLDPIVALLAGANILWTGFGLIRDSVNGLMDGSIPEDELIVVKEVLDSYRSPDVEFHAVRSRVAGNRHFMDMHVLVPGAWSVKKGHDLTEEVIDDLVARLPDLRVQAHLEPKEDPKSYDDIGI